MRRAVLTVGGTVAGLVALFSYRTHVPGVTPVAEPSTPAALSATAPPVTAGSGAASSPSPSPSKSKKPKPKPTPSASRTTAPAVTQQAIPTPTPTKTTAPPKPTTQQFQGPNVDTQYGPVQVVITVSGGKITAANDVQQPDSSVGANAVPQLNQEVLTAQSANIQAVSGATYTSNGYIQSLQQAVNQAGL